MSIEPLRESTPGHDDAFWPVTLEGFLKGCIMTTQLELSFKSASADTKRGICFQFGKSPFIDCNNQKAVIAQKTVLTHSH
jgi:hypothetical protein